MKLLAALLACLAFLSAGAVSSPSTGEEPSEALLPGAFSPRSLSTSSAALAKVRCPAEAGWPRDRYTGPGGGLYEGPGGGLYIGPGGGASTGYGGGLSTSPGGGLSDRYGDGLSIAPCGGLYTGPGGGLSTSFGGGLDTGNGGGLSRAPGGGLYEGASDKPYRSNIPPWPRFAEELDRRGLHEEAALIRSHLKR